MCLSETAAILVLFLLEESLNDVAWHLPGSISLMPASGSEQVCSEPFSPDVHLPPVPSAASCPVHFRGCHFPPSTALLGSVSLTLPPRFPSVPLSVPASPKAVPALQSAAGVVCHCTAIHNAAGASPELLSQDLTNLLLRKAQGPGNSFWQLVSCLQSVHLCHG